MYSLVAGWIAFGSLCFFAVYTCHLFLVLAVRHGLDKPLFPMKPFFLSIDDWEDVGLSIFIGCFCCAYVIAIALTWPISVPALIIFALAEVTRYFVKRGEVND